MYIHAWLLHVSLKCPCAPHGVTVVFNARLMPSQAKRSWTLFIGLDDVCELA
jgi:hypothetical protein